MAQGRETREYTVIYRVIGTDEELDDTICGSNVEAAILNLRDKIRHNHNPSEPIRKRGIVIDSVVLENTWTSEVVASG